MLNHNPYTGVNILNDFAKVVGKIHAY